MLASLSTQSLNQFADNMLSAEALSAEIANIHAALAVTSCLQDSPEVGTPKPEYHLTKAQE